MALWGELDAVGRVSPGPVYSDVKPGNSCLKHSIREGEMGNADWRKALVFVNFDFDIAKVFVSARYFNVDLFDCKPIESRYALVQTMCALSRDLVSPTLR